MDIRTKKFTDAEFEALPRYRGRLTDMVAAYPYLTKDQVNMLHSDDWSYYYEIELGLEYEMELLRGAA